MWSAWEVGIGQEQVVVVGVGGKSFPRREREREQNLSRPICRERVWPIRGPEGQSVQLGKRAQVAVLLKRQEE